MNMNSFVRLWAAETKVESVSGGSSSICGLGPNSKTGHASGAGMSSTFVSLIHVETRAVELTR